MQTLRSMVAKATIRSAAFSGVAALLATGVLFAQARPKAEVTPVVESAVHAGGTVRVALQVALPEGLHVQSDKPRDPMLIPTVLTVEPPAGVKVEQIVYPPATDFAQAGQKAPLAVFENRFAIGVELQVDRSIAAGEVKVPVRLRYQACDSSTCFIPARESAEWTVAVVPAGTPTPAASAAVFSSIQFQRR